MHHSSARATVREREREEGRLLALQNLSRQPAGWDGGARPPPPGGPEGAATGDGKWGRGARGAAGPQV
ncbi:unnamed protein product [Closterium sp. NIES-65]|nr:unnamed protein product [Closterium sp. NIES-65]